MLKRHVIDFVAMNAITLAVSVLAYLAGSKMADTFVLVLFVASGVIMIFGGLFGFLLASTMFWAFGRFSRKGETTQNAKNQTRERQATGNRFIILGFALLAESVLLALTIR